MEGHKYVSAYFSDQNKQTVMSFWEDPDDTDCLVEFTIQADPEDPDYKALLEHVSVDELHTNTWEYIKESEQGFKDQVIAIAKENGWIVNIDDGGSNDLYKILIDLLFNFNKEEDKERLFHFKLQLFEQEFLKNCKDKEIKKKIRRSETILEVVSHAVSIFDTTQVSSSQDDSD
jgi:hypothetical protein